MRLSAPLHGPWLGMARLHRPACRGWQHSRRFSEQQRSSSGQQQQRGRAAHGCLTTCHLPNYTQARKSPQQQRGSTFPFIDRFEMSRGVSIDSDQVFQMLEPLCGEERLARIDSVVANRTFNVLPIVEGLYDLGNLAAVFRSADALGFGAVHCIKNKWYKQSKRASGGAEKWLDVQLWDDASECLAAAKEMGYQIVATHLSPDAVDISCVDWTRPTAFVLGNEKQGVSETTLAMADQHVVVPMVGFVESFNVSVAAALILYQARATRLQKLGYHGDLSEEERKILRALMLLRNKGQTSEVVRQLLMRPPPDWQIYRGNGDWGGKFKEPPQPSETRCHYWDGEQCYGETLIYPGKTCTHAAGHRPGAITLNKHKLRLMCEAKGLPLPPALQGGGPLPQSQQQPAGGSSSGGEAGVAPSSSEDPQQQQQQHLDQQQELAAV